MVKRGKAPKRGGIKRTRIFEKYKHAYKNHRVVTVVSTLVAGALVIYGGLIFIEYLQFKRAESKINSLYEQVLAEFPENERASVGGSCGYASAKYSRGRLGCSYGFGIRIHETSLKKANEIANKFDQILKKQGVFDIKFESSSGQIDLSVKSKSGYLNRKGYDFSDGFMGVGCNGGVGYDKKTIEELTDEERSSLGKTELPNEYVQISVVCGKSPSLISHYPVEK